MRLHNVGNAKIRNLRSLEGSTLQPEVFYYLGQSTMLNIPLSGSLAIRYSDLSGFRPISGQTWPQNPSRTTVLVLQCRLHQKSAPQTKSKTISWQFGILKSPPPMSR